MAGVFEAPSCHLPPFLPHLPASNPSLSPFSSISPPPTHTHHFIDVLDGIHDTNNKTKKMLKIGGTND